ncbi:MAG: UDP-N-acetylglucosamine 2-epimerase (non-hydrolyzing) [Actinobacteria bacterium]|nr:UDP-N-acetylglucosamine 2-epimerase (non-hydrolyzing) [Actinomycetota bacterium]
MTRTFKLLHVVGTRPNFMKVAPIMAAVDAWNERPAPAGATGVAVDVRFEQVLVHTGQHYDERMSGIFFRDLGLPKPDHYLEVGPGSHAGMTARVMLTLESVVLAERPDMVMVVGDVNSTLAAALVAAKLGLPTAHVEAGLRSRDRSMPEELNRLVTDQLSDILFTTSRDADENLTAEGIPSDKVFFVGNPMIDSLERFRDQALAGGALAARGLERHSYGAVTLHRPSNVDERFGLDRLARVLTRAAERLPLIFPVHTRTRERLARFGLLADLEAHPGLRLEEPLGYLDFLALLAGARLVLTDSGGIQEETTVLGVPCLTLRKNTERPVTVTQGTNRLVDPEDEEAIARAIDETLAASPEPTPRRPEFWDGHAGERIVTEVAGWLSRVAKAS